MAEQKIEKSDTFSFVLLGNMNPPLHHPQFYENSDLINRSESMGAINSPGMQCLPHISQFSFGQITMICIPTRWEIKCTSRSEIPRLRDMTLAVFDDILKLTPMSTIGFSWNVHLPTSTPNAGVRLAEQFARFGAPPSGSEGHWIWKSASDDLEQLVSVANSPVSPSHIFVTNNIFYKMSSQREGHAFTVAHFVERIMADRIPEMVQRAEAVLKSFNAIVA